MNNPESARKTVRQVSHRVTYVSVSVMVAISQVILLGFNKSITAQIIPDNTLGNESSVVTPETIKGIDSERISGGAVRGSNLFHSFQEFNIGEGRGGYFENPAVIENIFSRVTGSNPSEILGTLGVLGNANLFFLNPNGIIFGQNASLDVRGSFLATTADSIVFPDGNRFSAVNPDVPPLLTVNVQQPIGFEFEGREGIITNAADLAVAARQILSLSGSKVTTIGNLTAPGGKVELLGTNSIALLEDATIDVSAPTGGGTILIGKNENDIATAGSINIGADVTIKADGLLEGNGGIVKIEAEEIVEFEGSISATGENPGEVVLDALTVINHGAINLGAENSQQEKASEDGIESTCCEVDPSRYPLTLLPSLKKRSLLTPRRTVESS